MANANQLHNKVVGYANGQRQLMPLPVCKNDRNSKVKLIPISKTSQISSTIINQDIKKIESLIYQKKQSKIPLNLKISKEVTITSTSNVHDTENNIILNKLKKLPGISISLVKSEPVFKVPKSPRLKTNNNKKIITSHNKSKVFLEKKGLSERKDDNKEGMENCLTRNIINISNTNLNSSETVKHKQIFNNKSLITKCSDQGILKNPEASFKKYQVFEKENVQRTSSSKKLSKMISKSLKTIKPVEVSNNFNIFSKEVNKVSDKDAIINNTELKTNGLANESYMLMDLSTDGQFNIVPASFPSNCINDSVPEHNNFLTEVSKFSEDCGMHLETSKNGSLIIKEELDRFSDFPGCVNTSLNIYKSNYILSELTSQSSSSNGIDIIKDEQKHNPNVYFYNHNLKQLSPKNKDMNQRMDTSIIQEDKQLLRKITSDNSLENIHKNENKFMDFNTPISHILPINKKNLPDLKSNENENGIKRKQNELNEKLKKPKMC